jgi:hypothetical protein
MAYSRKINLPAGLRWMDLIDTPFWNKPPVLSRVRVDESSQRKAS